MPVNASREQILGRIRTALTKPAPPPPGGPPRAIFDPVTDLLDRFQKECAITLTECVVTDGQDASRDAIANILASLPAGDFFIQDVPELHGLVDGRTGDRPIRWSSESAPPKTTQVSLTLAEALVALTGSIVTSSSCGGRGASAVPDCHIVYARLDQLVPDLESALALIKQRGIAERNSYVGLITGSSRTADIEKILVLGAHGPRRLAVVLQTK
ncbi:MAG TPA: LUD domain-containing protein [Terriglobales bacterium]|nr:LUD domain-containing protein [Terriglobales bacterium]